jgi:TolB protein
MAFVSDRAGSPQIYISDLGGRGLRRLTTNGKQNTDPCWSPRGDRIAFVRDSKDVFTISPDGGSEAQLTAGAGRNNRPTWSPDGRLIVFSSTRNGRHELFTMTANGERQRPLLPDLNMEQRTPFWSPARPDDNLEANP